MLKIAEWLTLVWEIASTLVTHGLLDKSKLPKDFPKTKEELEQFIIKTAKNNVSDILADTYDVIDEWEED